MAVPIDFAYSSRRESPRSARWGCNRNQEESTLYSIKYLAWLIVAIVAIAVAPSVAAGDEQSAQALDSLAVEAGAQSLRGTTEPIKRHTTATQQVGRALLFVPYAGLRVIAWPIEALLEINESWEIAKRLGSLAIWSDKQTDVRLLYGYESSLGLSLFGLQATSYDRIESGSKLRVSAAYLNNDNSLAAFRFATTPKRLHYELFGRVERTENRPFYGVGPESPDDRHAANRRRMLGEVSVHFNPRDPFLVSITGYAREERLSDPSNNTPVSEGFPTLFARASKTQYTGVEASVALDTRNEGFYSTSGSLVRFTGGYNESWENGDEDYYHYSIDIGTFINLYRETRALGLFVFADGVEADDISSVPYTEFERLGGRTGGRGYARYRFVDQTQLLLIASYRYRATNFVMARMFVDWGTVAPDWDSIDLSDIDPSVGFGLSLGRDDRRVDFHVGHSREGFEFFIGNQTFSDLKSRRLR